MEELEVEVVKGPPPSFLCTVVTGEARRKENHSYAVWCESRPRLVYPQPLVESIVG